MYHILFDVNDPEIRQDFLKNVLMNAIRDLKEPIHALWGKMTTRQMVEHLIWTFQLSTGKSAETHTVPEDQADYRKKFLFNNRPTPHEVSNPMLEGGLPPYRFSSLEEAKRTLYEEVNQFLKHLRDFPEAIRPHPIFGELSMEEWERAHYKHGYHHLLQFGLVAEPDS
jgi:hypothetical protein